VEIVDKNVYNTVSNKADGYCIVCHEYGGDNLELHHILRRKVKSDEYNCIMLCKRCHRSEVGVHGRDGHTLDLKLKLELQDKYFSQGHTEDEVRTLMNGRLYLKEAIK